MKQCRGVLELLLLFYLFVLFYEQARWIINKQARCKYSLDCWVSRSSPSSASLIKSEIEVFFGSSSSFISVTGESVTQARTRNVELELDIAGLSFPVIYPNKSVFVEFVSVICLTVEFDGKKAT